MCIDDYQFRHPTATRPKICRRFIFSTHDGSERVFLVNISQFQMLGNLRLCEILVHLNRKGLNIKDFRFYLPQLDITIEAGDECVVPFNALANKQVIFQMERIEDEADKDIEQGSKMSFFLCNLGDDCQECHEDEQLPEHLIPVQAIQLKNPVEQKPEVKQKKAKQHEKTIEQALLKTKKWRMLHQILNYSLKNAAKFVGLSKKTLDDYFLVLRVGEQLGYNFVANKTKKIGHLRSFIRKNPIKVKGRLSKNLNCFDLVPQPDLSEFYPSRQYEKMIEVEQISSHKISSQQFISVENQQLAGNCHMMEEQY